MACSEDSTHGRRPNSRRPPDPAALFVVTGALLALGMAWMLQDAAARRRAGAAQAPPIHALVRLTGVADLALSSASRWLRHPSVTEPGAPFADGPAILDNDPAGALICPPLEVLGGLDGARPGRPLPLGGHGPKGGRRTDAARSTSGRSPRP